MADDYTCLRLLSSNIIKTNNTDALCNKEMKAKAENNISAIVEADAL